MMRQDSGESGKIQFYMREDREIGVLHGFLTHTHFVIAVGNTHHPT
jgi:hypothetical protein